MSPKLYKRDTLGNSGVANISLDVPEEILALMGPSGSEKQIAQSYFGSISRQADRFTLRNRYCKLNESALQSGFA